MAMASASLSFPHEKSRLLNYQTNCSRSKATKICQRRMSEIGSAKRRVVSVRCSSTKEEGPVVLRAAVSAVTELLRAFNRDGGESQRDSQSTSTAVNELTIAPEDLVETLRSDYALSYFLTGDFTDELYAEDCFFADPTVQFSGRDLYKRNLKLLVPFYEDPSLVLDSIEEVGDGESKFIQAFWRMRVYLKLPWKPFIAVDGSTKYDLDSTARIARHVESWNISAGQAIGQLFKPSERAFWRRPRSA